MTSPQSCPVFSDWWVHTKNGLLQPASPTGIKPKLFLKRTLYANTKEKKIALKMLLKCLIQEYCSQLPFQYFRKKSTYLNLRIFNHLTFCTQIHIYTCMYSYIHRYRYIQIYTSQGRFMLAIWNRFFFQRVTEHWTGSPGQGSQHQAWHSSGNVWTMLSGHGGTQGCCAGPGAGLIILCVPSNSGQSVILSASNQDRKAPFETRP